MTQQRIYMQRVYTYTCIMCVKEYVYIHTCTHKEDV